MFEYHFSFTDFNKKDGFIVKNFDKELSDEEISKELDIVINDNNAWSASLDYVKDI